MSSYLTCNIFFALTLAYHICHTSPSLWEDVSSAFMIPIRPWTLTWRNFIEVLTCLCVLPITSVCFDISIPYLAHGSITMRECVAFIHDPKKMLTFDLKVKFIRFLTCFCVWPIIFLFNIGLSYLAHGCITTRRCVEYIHDPDSTLTYDFKVKFIGFCCVCLLWQWHTIFSTWVYHHERMCLLHSWSWYDIDLLISRSNFIGFMTSLCVRARAFLYFDISHTVWHMSVSPWYNVSSTFMTSVWPWPLTLISKLYIHYEFESGIIKTVFALLHRHTKFWHMSVSPWDNMLCTFLSLVWPWPLTYMWVVGGILSEFYSQFLPCLYKFCGSPISEIYPINPIRMILRLI